MKPEPRRIMVLHGLGAPLMGDTTLLQQGQQALEDLAKPLLDQETATASQKVADATQAGIESYKPLIFVVGASIAAALYFGLKGSKRERNPQRRKVYR